jgi:hypothetical protein
MKHKSYPLALTSSSSDINPPHPSSSVRLKAIHSLAGRCFRCLSTTHLRKECREPLRCKHCLRYGHSSEPCRDNPSSSTSNALDLIPHTQPCFPSIKESNADIVMSLDRHEEEFSGALVMHHPVFGPARFPAPSELIYTGPIDITNF